MARINSGPLSALVRDLLRAFDGLTEDDRRDFFWETLRRTKALEWPPLDEETISRLADDFFLEYDIEYDICEAAFEEIHQQ